MTPTAAPAPTRTSHHEGTACLLVAVALSPCGKAVVPAGCWPEAEEEEVVVASVAAEPGWAAVQTAATVAGLWHQMGSRHLSQDTAQVQSPLDTPS